ncbi:MAG: hypothetical protein ABUL73_04670 [Alphaproteobacteria bacterium]
MSMKNIGEPCPNCATPLQRRRSTFRTIVGDVAYCARCCASYELVEAPADRRAVRKVAPQLA